MSAGLCETCRHHITVANNRGREFHLCLLNKTDSTYPKYPRLPVLECPGHSPVKEKNGKDQKP